MGDFDQDLLYKGFHLLFMFGLCQLKHKPFIFLFLWLEIFELTAWNS